VNRAASAILLVLAAVVFLRMRDGTVGPWFRAKFLNAADPNRIPSRMPARPPAAAPLPGAGGGWGRPIATAPGTSAGQRFGGPRPGRKHAGLDFPAPIGTPITAAQAGRVVFAGTQGGYGRMVVIDHGDGWTSRYAHLSSVAVRAGDTVTRGQTIAASGNTGRSTGPHLHFELRKDGVAQDPEPLLFVGTRQRPGVSAW
jgi:murein DD-endopeptidase MepM/ murein hydrolase activator NlpD